MRQTSGFPGGIMQPRSTSLCRRLLACAILTLMTASVRAQVDTSTIEEMIAKGNLQEALLTTEEQLSRNPNHVHLLFLKGLIHTSRNEFEPAKKIFIELTKNNPELPEPFNNLAVIYAAQGDYDSARLALQQAINTHPSYATAHENLGDIYAKLASKAYNQALELDEKNVNAKEKLLLVSDLAPKARGAIPQPDNQSALELEQSRNKVVELEQALSNARQRNTTDLETSSRELAKTRQMLERQQAEVKVLNEKLAGVETQLSEAQTELARLKTAPVVASNPTDVLNETKQTMDATRKPAAAPPVVGDNRSEREAILMAVNDWAERWSAKDVEAYLAAYSSSFAPQGMTRQRWMNQRRERLLGPSRIVVKIVSPTVNIVSPLEARVVFTQEYASDNYRDRVLKTLSLTKQSGKWLIEEERTD